MVICTKLVGRGVTVVVVVVSACRVRARVLVVGTRAPCQPCGVVLCLRCFACKMIDFKRFPPPVELLLAAACWCCCLLLLVLLVLLSAA